LSCPCGGFPSIRHNKLRDTTAALLFKTCQSVSVEATLQPLTDELFSYWSANVEDGAWLDVRLRVFGIMTGGWLSLTLKYLINPFAPSYLTSSITQYYHRAELEKKRKYDDRIGEVISFH